MQGDYPVARVYLLDVPYHIDKLYDYYIPEELRGTLAVGGFAAGLVADCGTACGEARERGVLVFARVHSSGVGR